MMAYSNQFVVSVLVNGKPQREFSSDGKRSVTIPFGTEYKILVKNQSYKKVLVNVSIDGVPIFSAGKQLVLNGKSGIELERFVDDLNGGRKFKFVSQDQAAMEGHFDPTTPEMGLLKIEFVPELPRLTISDPLWGGILRGGSGGLTGGGVTSSMGPQGVVGSHNQFYCAINNASTQSNVQASSDKISIGGTVEGLESNQKFSMNTDLILWNYSLKTTIDVQMKGPKPSVDFGIDGLSNIVRKDAKEYKIHSVMTTTEGSITVVYR